MSLTHHQKYLAIVQLYEHAVGRPASKLEKTNLKKAHDDSQHDGSLMASLALGDYVGAWVNKDWPGPMRAEARRVYGLAEPQPERDQGVRSVMEA